MTRNTAFESRLVIAIGTALLALSVGAAAQTAGTTTQSPAPTVKSAGGSTLERGDRNFVEKAAEGGLAEVELGKIAQQRATHAQVKMFADNMAQDHGKANQELMALATAKGLQPPAEPDRSHRRQAERLTKLSGPAFDREYMKQMVDDHKKTVAEFQKASRAAKDSEIKAFAARTLPTLQQHLQLAQTIHDAVHSSADNNPKVGMSPGGTTSR